MRSNASKHLQYLTDNIKINQNQDSVTWFQDWKNWMTEYLMWKTFLNVVYDCIRIALCIVLNFIFVFCFSSVLPLTLKLQHIIPRCFLKRMVSKSFYSGFDLQLMGVLVNYRNLRKILTMIFQMKISQNPS